MNPIEFNYTSNLTNLTAVRALMSSNNDDNWTVLLDSGRHSKEFNNPKLTESLTNSRFDIFSAKPSLFLSQNFNNTKNQYQLTVKATNSVTNLLDIDLTVQDPLQQMRRISKQFKQSNKEGWQASKTAKLPFNGGWLGYFSYDFGKNLEIKSHANLNPNEIPLCCFGFYLWALITDHQLKTTTLYNFGLNGEEWLAIQQLFSDSHEMKAQYSSNHFQLKSPFKTRVNFNNYEEKFDKIQAHIEDGDCYQINYTHQFTSTFKGNVLDAYLKLSEVNKSPFSAYLNFGYFTILSLSPERFIKLENNQVITQPIKGTAPRDKDKKQDQENAFQLSNSDKDKAENLMIVDLLRNDLSRTASKGSVKVPELFKLYSFESVHHLISTVTSQLDHQYDAFDLMRTCLPGGSITGAPKIAAMKIIDELEDFKRGIYCGVIGYFDMNGNMDTNICIRTILAKNGKLTCSAGGGIVYDSKSELEYQETFHKVSKLIPVLEEHFLNDHQKDTVNDVH